MKSWRLKTSKQYLFGARGAKIQWYCSVPSGLFGREKSWMAIPLLMVTSLHRALRTQSRSCVPCCKCKELSSSCYHFVHRSETQSPGDRHTTALQTQNELVDAILWCLILDTWWLSKRILISWKKMLRDNKGLLIESQWATVWSLGKSRNKRIWLSPTCRRKWAGVASREIK